MQDKNVLVYETDPLIERQLNEVLSAAGYMVYAADRLDAAMKALASATFPVVLVDMSAAEVDPPALALQVTEKDPDCMVIFTGLAITSASILAMMRGGAADYVSKPVDPHDLVNAVGLAFHRRNRRRDAARSWKKRAKAAEAALKAGGGGVTDIAVSEFADAALQKLLAAERRLDELERRNEPPSANRANGAVVAWVAHSDADFAGGVVSLGMRLNIDVRPALSTGGEVLDKLSSQRPSMIVVGDALPDIPGELVAETVISQYPEVQMILVSGWGSQRRTVQLISATASSPPVEMKTVDELMQAIVEARDRSFESENSRDFAGRFRQKHEEFIRRYSEIKQTR